MPQMLHKHFACARSGPFPFRSRSVPRSVFGPAFPALEDMKGRLQDEADEGLSPDIPVGVPAPKVAGLQLGSMGKPAGKVKKSAAPKRGAPTGSASLLALEAGGDDDKSDADPAVSESRHSGFSKGSKIGDGIGDGCLDEEMQEVANVHLKHGTRSKSLELLTAERFLIPDKTAKSKYGCSAVITGVAGLKISFFVAIYLCFLHVSLLTCLQSTYTSTFE